MRENTEGNAMADTGAESTSAQNDRISVELAFPPALNYALVHNKVPVARYVRLRNLTEEDISAVDVTVEVLGPDGPLAPAWQRQLQRLRSGAELVRHDFADLTPDPAALADTDEAYPIRYRVTVDTGDTVDAADTADGDPTAPLRAEGHSRVLAHNEWFNSPSLYESIAAFVQPNTDSVTHILRGARDLLETDTGDSSLQGYQHGSERAALIGGAVYESLRRQRISYVGVPASFERTGQKVRSTAAVLRDQLGDCLDLAVTYAACLEQAGLNPLVWIVSGHAFAGFFLDEERLSETVSTDPNHMINLVESRRALAIELTGIGPGDESADYSQALRSGTEHFRVGREHLLGMVDVALAHRSGIRSLPSRDRHDPEPEPAAAQQPSTAAIVLPDELRQSTAFTAEPNLATTDTGSAPIPERIERWRKSLLDLSLRNPLLQLPARGKGLDLHVPSGSLPVLDDRMHQGKHVRLVAADTVGGVAQERGVTRAQELPDETVAEELRRDNRVYGNVAERTYVTTMRGLQRDARTIQQETGGNYLYLTFGTLVHPGKSGEAHAPLFLLPVRIEGGTGNSPYTVVIDGDETAAPNYCLVEWLRAKHGVTIPELSDPILDEDGIDIERSFEAIRGRLLRHDLHYRVDEGASLRLLRFATFQMWRDLTEHWDHFMTNPVVRHLVDKPGHEFSDPARGDDGDTFDEGRLHLPIPADGSQMRAVSMAGNGRSFVLEGPPGTGKSQTITNLIAHALRNGQKVLFVAEKQAALDVVKRRMADIGLGEFCLDLHGREQSLPNIKSQLQAARDRVPQPDEHGWKAVEAQFRRNFGPLRTYPERVHTRNAARMSVWDAYAATLAHGDGPRADIPDEFFTSPTDQQDTVTATVADLPATAESAFLRAHHPWAISGHRGVDGLDRDALLSAADELENARESFHRMPEQLHTELTALEWPTLAGAAVPSARLAASGRLPDANAMSAATEHGWDETVTALLDELEQFRQQHEDVLATFRPEFFDSDEFASWEAEAAASRKGLFGRKKKRLALLERLRPYVAAGAAPEPESIRETVESASRARQASEELAERIRAVLGLHLPETWAPTLPDAVARLRSARDELVTGRALRAEQPAVWSALHSLGTAAPAAGLQRFVTAWADWLRHMTTGNDEFRRFADDRGWAQAWEHDGPAWCRELRNQQLLPLQRWGALLDTTDALVQCGLSQFREQVLSGQFPSGDTETVFWRGYAHAALRERLTVNELQYFDPQQHEHHVTEYLERSDELRGQLPERLAQDIVAQRPGLDEANSERDREFIRHLTTARRGKNRLSFRELLAKYPDAVTGLTPCFLMSPTSVANFLQPGAVEFDLVVFDEASQIRVPQAIGALGRARAAVVVGDSKQMPPTSVMEASHSEASDESGDDDAPPVDLDSILEECVESGIEQEWLSWHYRSSDESLITFSNRYYYNGKLQSLPSPGGSAHTGVRLRRVDGVFDRGKSRTNEVEAREIVAEVGRLLDNPESAERSIGVVTFNVHQRDLILNLLEDSSDNRIHDALNAEHEELFVKNLENVQGDERDVMLFSLAFSNDPETGKLPLQWGPMSNTGGERRFNVAVTRARQEVLLLCSFDPKDIDLARTSSVGLRHLRAYLELADGGFDQLADDASHHVERSARILGEVAEELRSRGHTVATNLGLSEFTVDLAVSAPGATQWQTAVLLDGPGWAERATVADRDGAPQLLGAIMNWPRTVRVWLPAWLHDRQAILDRIDNAVAEASKTTEPVATTPQRSPSTDGRSIPETPQGPDDSVAEDTGTNRSSWIGSDNMPPTTDTAPPEPAPIASQPAPLRTRFGSQAPTEDASPMVPGNGMRADSDVAPEPFVPYAPSIVASRDTLDQLDDSPQAQRMLRETFAAIVEAEGPIEINRLAKTALHCFDLDRVRQHRVNTALKYLPRQLKRRETPLGTWVWPEHADPDTWQGCRQTQEPTDRDIGDIAPEEIVNAMRRVLHSGADSDRLYRDALELLGHSRMTARVKTVLGSALEFGIQSAQLPVGIRDL